MKFEQNDYGGGEGGFGHDYGNDYEGGGGGGAKILEKRIT